MIKIAIIGLGYVGLPLALEFSKKYKVVGFDINVHRIQQLKRNFDINNEISKNLLKKSSLFLSSNKKDLYNNNYFIITVPTPINKFNKPNKTNLFSSCQTISKYLKKNDIIIFESTVYPGLTEEECVPILEKFSGLKYNKDFFCGYSPERVNPGDKKRTISNILKITSGSNKKTLTKVDNLYKSIIKAGTYKVSSIKIAEAAKIIENSQRDLNIGFVNEISKIFDKMNLNTNEILKAASTKWNFLNFKPGLVGGHCIGVDPYYLTYKAKKIGLNPEIILSARKVNDSMGSYVSTKLFKEMNKKNIFLKKSKILIMGITFKENCSDIRNSKIFDVIKILKNKVATVDVYDPIVNKDSLKGNLNFNFIIKPKYHHYDSIIIAVAHDNFKKIGKNNIFKYTKKKNVIFDLKNIFNDNKVFLNI